MCSDMLPLKINNCIFRKKCEGGGDDEERLRIRNLLKAATHRRTKIDCIMFEMNTWKG